MIKIYYFETQDYNGLIATDGEQAICFDDFPQDGTLEMAKCCDLSGIEGAHTLDDVIRYIGVEFEKYDFNEHANDNMTFICNL